MEAYVLEVNKPENYWSFLNTDAVELIWVISAISSECLDEYFRNAPNICSCHSTAYILKTKQIKQQLRKKETWRFIYIAMLIAKSDLASKLYR